MDEQVAQAADRRIAPAPASHSAGVARRVVENLRRVIHAPDEPLELAVLCLLSEGHLIIEDFPGVGKDDAREGDRPLGRLRLLAAVSSRRTCCRRT